MVAWLGRSPRFEPYPPQLPPLLFQPCLDRLGGCIPHASRFSEKNEESLNDTYKKVRD